MTQPGEVTGLLAAWRGGDSGALDRLIPIVYEDLRRVAARYMRSEQPGHTLQTTALVHEAYMRLTREQDRTWENRAHFFAVAAQIMRNLLVDHARAAAREKRGGGAAHLALDEESGLTAVDPDVLLALDDAMRRLAEVDPRASRIVELRYFVGLSNEEVADVIGTTERTVRRDWNTAKAWLRAELRSRQ
ncbi:MAG: sigma-70 family RNA polymerase sigma factor [Acidobacteria bacterium]|nr:sigma-70 family RNA polymerase sigma factor [Acidobacteriota bacterium]